MVGDVSAYAALGLEPGADAAQIERAYKRLIKLHHPDRRGGDGERAAEINRAYRDLRRDAGSHDPLILHDDEPVETRGKRWVRTAIVLVAGVGLLVLIGPVANYIRGVSPPAAAAIPGGEARTPMKPDTMDQPLHLAEIKGAVRQAVANGRNQRALLSASRDCHRVLRQYPSVDQLDRCAAFDDAVVQLQDRDAMWDEGPFSQISVTGRQWSAASSLSNDYLAIDSRLDRIRVQVELVLAPPAPPAIRSLSATPEANLADDLKLIPQKPAGKQAERD